MTNALAEIAKTWDSEIVQVLQAQTIGRKLIPLNAKLSHKGLGMTEIGTNAFTARAAALIDYEIVEDNLGTETVDVTAKSLKVPVQQDDNILPRRAYEAYKQKGIAIDSGIAADMAAKIAALEDTMIIQGWTADGTNYEINGMYQVANNSVAGSSFGTYGGAVTSIAAAFGALSTDKIYSMGWNLTLHPTQYYELMGSYSTSGLWEYNQVIEMLNTNAPGKPGTVFVSTDMTDGTGMVSPVATPANMRFFDLIEAYAPTFDTWIEGSQKTGPIHVRLLGALVPRFKHLDGSNLDDCICKLTTI